MGANACIFCGAAEKLSASMTVTLEDGSTAQVQICEEHAEDATVKTARAAYMAKRKQIDDVMAAAAALGLSLVPVGKSGLVVANAPAPVAAPAAQAPAADRPFAASILEDDEEGQLVSTSKLDRGMVSVGGTTAHQSGVRTSVSSYSSHAIGTAFNKDGHSLDPSVRNGKAKMVVAEGRGGSPVAIPAMRQDGTGLTKLRIANTFNDGKLQSRFKQLAEASRGDRGPDFRNEYEAGVERGCPICGGGGETTNRGQKVLCPKCGGSGII